MVEGLQEVLTVTLRRNQSDAFKHEVRVLLNVSHVRAIDLPKHVLVDLFRLLLIVVKILLVRFNGLPILVYIVLALFVGCILLFFWMRWRMRASKGRFALAVVSTMLTCLLSGLSAMSASLPTVLASKVSEAVGWGPVDSGAPTFLVLPLTALAIFFIYRFGSLTIKHWEAPPRVSEIDLAEKYLDNSIAALSLEQLKLFFKGQRDPLASDAVANWKERVSEPPAPVPTNVLLRDMLVEAMGEIRITDDGWRDEGKLWVGEKLGLRAEDTKNVLVLIFETCPDKKVMETRLNSLVESYGRFDDFELIALYMSDGSSKEQQGTLGVLGKPVRVYSSRELILMGLELENYARLIIDAFERTKVGGTEVTLAGSYVELGVSIEGASKEPNTLADSISAWLEDTTGKQIAVTGEYGQGKSTGLLKFCYDWAKRFTETQALDERVPLLIELRGQSPSETDPLGFLSPWCSRFRLSPRQVYNLIKSGDAIVIFEGFDELRNSGRAYYRHQHFNALWKFAFPGTKLLFTGRPNFFLDEAEANRTLRNQEARKLGGDLYTDIWKLEKLTIPQIEGACRNYDAEVSRGIKQAVDSNPDFLDIVSRPSMLPVVATIWSEIDDLRSKGSLLTGAVLIEKYIQAVFARKEAELERAQRKSDAPVGSRYLVLPKQVREFLTICVAWRMSGLRLKNTIPRAEITDMIREMYDTLLSVSKSSGVSPEVAEGMINFEQRFKDDSPAERIEAIATEICSSGLLVPDPAGGAGNLRFPHKQFFEFLVAKGIAIKAHNSASNAAIILDKCSSGTTVVSRLINEPNSTLYLTECVGDSLETFSSSFQRLALQIVVAQQIMIQTCVQILAGRRKHSIEEVEGRQVTLDYERAWRLERVTRALLFTAGTAMIFWFLLAFGIGYIEIVAAVAVEVLDDPNSGFSILFVSGDPEGAIPDQAKMTDLIKVISMLSFLLVCLIMIRIMMFTVSEGGWSKVMHLFLRIHWDKHGELPKSRLSELRATYASLSLGRVKFVTPREDTTDYRLFLYPAEDLGSG